MNLNGTCTERNLKFSTTFQHLEFFIDLSNMYGINIPLKVGETSENMF